MSGAARQRRGPGFGYSFDPVCVAGDRQRGRAESEEASEHAAAVSAGPSFGAIGLLDDRGAAAFFGVSLRAFVAFLNAEWMPQAIVLGPRTRRWSIDELRAAIARMPRESERRPMPTPLRARVEALKGREPAKEASNAL